MKKSSLSGLSSLQSLLSDSDKKKLAEEKTKRDQQEIEAKKKIEALTVKEMDIESFPAFIRMNYVELRSYSNKALMDLGKEFKDYLHEVFKADMKKGEKIWDIRPATVVWRQMSDPFCIKGYDPVFVFHYCEFVEKMKKQILEQTGQKANT